MAEVLTERWPLSDEGTESIEEAVPLQMFKKCRGLTAWQNQAIQRSQIFRQTDKRGIHAERAKNLGVCFKRTLHGENADSQMFRGH